MNVPRTRWRSCLPFVSTSPWVGILIALLIGLPSPRSRGFQATPKRQSRRSANADRLEHDKDGYVGSATCASCHAGISASFLKTQMGQSIKRFSSADLVKLTVPDSFDNSTTGRHFEVSSHDGRLFQSESQKSSNDQEVFRDTHEVKWLIGGGANGYTGVVQRGAYLFEAPMSYYIRTKHWEPSPGYETEDIGFRRTILAGCISCHTGRPNPLEQDTGKYAAEPFSQLAVGCENCHGPGAAHVHAMRSNASGSRGSLIVNPNKLSADLENDICMSCHEAGDSRVPKPGKTYQDFRPGTPLDNAVSIFMYPLKPTDRDTRDHVQHYFQMSMSKCFRASSRQLRCTSCHDPHVQPTQQEAPAYFKQKCLSCHSNDDCKQSRSIRQSTAPADNCISCHMPRREAQEAAHTALTNHRIIARPGEPWPKEAFEQTTADLPDLVHLNRPRNGADALPASTLLEAYREMAERRPEYAQAYDRLLQQMEHSEPNQAGVQFGLGKKDLDSGALDQAAEHLRRAIELDPKNARSYFLLSQALDKQGHLEEAVAAGEAAVSMEPYEPLYQKSLISDLVDAKQYDKAVSAMQRYISEFPEDEFMRKMLEIARQ